MSQSNPTTSILDMTGARVAFALEGRRLILITPWGFCVVGCRWIILLAFTNFPAIKSLSVESRRFGIPFTDTFAGYIVFNVASQVVLDS